MSDITQGQSTAVGAFQQPNRLSDKSMGSRVQEQSFNARESLDAGLTIRTREGDLVTLTSSSFSEIDSYMYNAKGMVETDSGTARVQQNYREITLSTGESFSFTVVGELSEAELADIEAIVQGIDEIISEMAEGDMEEAVGLALSMGSYDSVSQYSANITYQRSYEMRSEELYSMPAAELAEEPILKEDRTLPVIGKPVFPNTEKGRKAHTIKQYERLIDKMSKMLEEQEEALLEKTQEPLSNLFNHHLDKMAEEEEKPSENYKAIEHARMQADLISENIVNNVFKDTFANLFKE
ncbi:MAG: hypothetical protein GY729_01055 [Desulfobacteraceae bacterium]|nr:hypothetical protein [Desulfobacteraceae bacterium]